MAAISPFLNTYVLAKFYFSKAPNGSYYLISRSLGKFSVIDQRTKAKVNEKEIWVCKIVKEIRPNDNSGCFVLWPIKKVEQPEKQLRKLIPGFYEESRVGRGVFVKPTVDKQDYWMISYVTRKVFSKKYYAVVVPFMYEGPDTMDVAQNSVTTEAAEVACVSQTETDK